MMFYLQQLLVAAGGLLLCVDSAVVHGFAFSPSSSTHRRTIVSFLSSSASSTSTSTTTILHMGYLDELNKAQDLSNTDWAKEKKESEYDESTESYEATVYDRNQVDRYGPGSLQDFVDFQDEFDGGDGQMGVAGDGNKGLEKIGDTPQVMKMDQSRMRSAKNAWGTSTGYADELRNSNPSMDTARAQQLENWSNQREIHRNQQYVADMEMADRAKQDAGELNWRELAKFGVERNQKFDLDETFGDVVAGPITETFEFRTVIGRADVKTIAFKNDYMGFADFRARFTSDSMQGFDVNPNEGSCSKNPIDINVRFMPQSLGVSEATLVIETEDFKKTYKLYGTTG